MSLTSLLRRPLAWSHLWLGLIGGLGFCLFGVTGAIVTFRPDIASLLSPRAVGALPCRGVDWNQAQREIEAASGSTINRVYAPAGADPRYHFRMRTDVDAIYTHVIYDACAGRVLGTARLEWMDWLVDLHHNLLAGRAGRQAGGAIGIALLLGGAGGLLLTLLSGRRLGRILLVQGGDTRRMMFDLHRVTGLGVVVLLLIEAFTGVWLCYPQTMRGALAWIAPVQADVRPPRSGGHGDAAPALLGDLIVSAQHAIPDGRIREIRMPDGRGNVQVRMRRAGDFRSLGNNVVSLDRVSAQVVGRDLYAAAPGGNRFVQAMAGLHYGEWGGPLVRVLYGIAGLATLPLLLTGTFYWWLRRRRAVPAARTAVDRDRGALSTHSTSV